MARLIDVAPASSFPAVLFVHVGDVLLIRASGSRVDDGHEALELIGPLVSAVAASDGDVIVPIGIPNVLVVRAVRPGTVRLTLFVGHELSKPHSHSLTLNVND